MSEVVPDSRLKSSEFPGTDQRQLPREVLHGLLLVDQGRPSRVDDRRPLARLEARDIHPPVRDAHDVGRLENTFLADETRNGLAMVSLMARASVSCTATIATTKASCGIDDERSGRGHTCATDASQRRCRSSSTRCRQRRPRARTMASSA